MLVSVPANVEFEKYILTIGINLVRDLLTKKYPTQLDHDLEILKTPNLPWRTYLAVTHRTAQKEALASQLHLLSVLLSILRKFEPA